METCTQVFCDWTLLDLIGRFCIFSVWGYYMGKSVIHSPNKTWAQIVAGVLLCVFIHMGMHTGDLPHPDMSGAEAWPTAFDTERQGLLRYGIKIFIFYLFSSYVGYCAGRQKAGEKAAELDRVLAVLKKLETGGDEGSGGTENAKNGTCGYPVHPSVFPEEKGLSGLEENRQ